MELLQELKPRHDRAKSFYKKAYVYRDTSGILYLKSYSTIVASIQDPATTETGKAKVTINGYYSQTTARHINEFLLQYNIINRALSKKEIEERSVE